MKKLLILLGLIPILAFGQLRDTKLVNTMTHAKEYKARFIPDGGRMNSDNLMKAAYLFLEEKGLYDETRLLFMPEAGLKCREEGADKLLSYGYDLSGFTNDVSQTTALLQPYISGTQEAEYTWGVSSAYGAYVNHPSIAISGDYTVVKAQYSIGQLGVDVTFTTVSSGTLSSIIWTGDLFYYRVQEGLMNQTDKDYEKEWLESWIVPVTNESLYQGLEWTQESTNYTRLGSIKTIPTGQSAGSANLPIHSQMKRCMLFDNGSVNYYIDPAEPINETGVGYVKTGTTTGVGTDKLIDSSGDFITNGVVAGMTVRNVSTGNIAVIYSVTATELTLSRNYFTSGVAYQIGSANYGGSDGQVMVEIPKFYIRQEYFDNKIRWAISLQQLAGFQLHPAFFKDGAEVNYRYYSAFEGSMFDASTSAMTAKASIHLNLYATGDKFCSVAGQWPKTAERWDEYDAGSEARGAGWRNIDFALNSAVQLLYLIEYASFQSQAMIGAGRTNLSHASNSWVADSYIGQTGLSIKDGNGTASVQLGTTLGVLTDYMSYRGIENWYGNVWKILSFIAWDGSWTGTTAPQPVYWTNDVSKKKYTESTGMTLLVNASYIGALEGYQSAFENQYGFIPSKIGSSSVVGDYYWQYDRVENNTWRLVRFGGSASDGGVPVGGVWAGGFTLNAADGWPLAYIPFGGRVCF